MASQPFSVSKLIDMLGAARSSDEKRITSLGVFIGVDLTADRDLIECIKTCFTSKRLDTVVAVRDLADSRAEVAGAHDAAVFVVGEYGDLAALLAVERARRGVPCAIVAQSSLDLPDLEGLDPSTAQLIRGIFASSLDTLERKLARWLLDSTDKDIACAASFEFCRPVLATRLRLRTAIENTMLALTGMASGSDFSVMTANEAYLAFDIAAIYGDELTMQVLADLGLVLLTASGSRTVARFIEMMLPFGKRFTRGAFAFGGTLVAAHLVEYRHDGTLDEALRALTHRLALQVESGNSLAITPARLNKAL